MDEPKTILFVYGTLKRRDCRNHVLEGGRFIGTAKTTPDFTLFSCGAFPAMVESDDRRTGVCGELYEVPTSLLDNRLDYIEGVPTLYDRGTVTLAEVNAENPGPDSEITRATSYIYQRGTGRLPHLGTTWTVEGDR